MNLPFYKTKISIDHKLSFAPPKEWFIYLVISYLTHTKKYYEPSFLQVSKGPRLPRKHHVSFEVDPRAR